MIERPGRPLLVAYLVLPAAVTLVLAFFDGGYFPDATGAAAVVLAAALMIRCTLAYEPFAGVNARVAVVGALLGAFAAWTLLSGAWSDAPGRALVEFDRALLYMLAFATLGIVGYSPARLRIAVQAMATVMTVVVLTGLATRLAPDVFPIAREIQIDRLSYPLSYWNALGLMGSIAILLALHIAADLRNRAAVRAAAASVVPPLVAALLLTFSRGALAAGLLGLVAWLALGGPPRPRLAAAISVVPGATVAGILAYGASEIASRTPTSPAAVDEGHQLAVWLLLCALATALLHTAARRFDARRRERPRPNAPRWAVAAALGVCAIAVAGAGLALDLDERVSTQYHRFVDDNEVDPSDTRSRLTRVGNNGRLEHWRVALDGADGAPLRGNGAGTFVLLWERNANTSYVVTEAHSLYIEVLGELGVVGLALIGTAILLLLASLAVRAQRTRDPALAALVAAGLVWIVHAGVDWDWEMPAVTLWWFALGGLGIAGSPATGDRRASNLARVTVALVAIFVAMTPAALLFSQRHLNRAAAAIERGDCREAIDAALSASRLAPMRPESYEALGICDVRLGQPRLAVEALDKAVDRDPDNWRVHYELALARGAARLDPRPAARAALRLSPHEPLAQEAVRRFDTNEPSSWRRRALSARLP